MRVIYFAFILGLISCSTWSSVINVWYNYEYSLLKDYSDQYTAWYWYFRVPVIHDNTMDMEIKVLKGVENYFTITVYEFNSYTNPPTDSAVMNPGADKLIYAEDSNNYNEDKYIVYYFTYRASHTATYFAVHVSLTSRHDFDYVIFRVNLSKYLYSRINDLDFNQKYELDTSRFYQGIIPQYYKIYIRISVIEEDNMEVQLETHEAYDKTTAFTVNVCQYTYKPTEEQVYYPTYDSLCKDPLTNESKESEKYAYPFTTDKDTKYLSIRVINNLYNLNYLYILIYSEKGLAAAIIAVIVIVPLLVIGAIVFVVLKKCGCIGRS